MFQRSADKGGSTIPIACFSLPPVMKHESRWTYVMVLTFTSTIHLHYVTLPFTESRVITYSREGGRNVRFNEKFVVSGPRIFHKLKTGLGESTL